MKTTMTKNNIFTFLVLMVNLLFVSSILGKEPFVNSTKNKNNKPISTTTNIISGIWQSIVAGTDNSFGIKSDGTLWAWGRNNYGKLGDGTTTDRFFPVQIGTANNWKSISTSDDFTVGLKTDGTLWGWGSNYYGGFGDGTSGTVTYKNTPTQIGTATNWQSISAGLSHTFALKTDGTIWAWGYNYFGQLGDGTSGTGSNKNIPTQIGTETNWKSVSAGDYHTIGLKNDGTLWAWGNNYRGQLGDGTNTNSYIPVQAGSSTNWQSISVGRRQFSAGLKTDGTLWTWGYNDLCQLGDGTTVQKNTPTQIGIATNWKSISTGNASTDGIKTDGTLWGWGYGFSGDGKSYVYQSTPVQIGTATDWQSISAGGGHTLGLKTDCVQFVATGANSNGQLGDGTGVNTLVFKCVTEAVTYTLSCPPNKTVNTDPSSCTAKVNDIDPVITPIGGGVNCTIGNVTGQGSASGSTFNKGVTTVTYSITSDPSKTCSFTVTVLDNQAPVLTCPTNQTIDVIANTSAGNYIIADPISDNCTGSTWGYTLTGATTGTKSGIADYTGSGVLSFNKGVTTVTLSGTDETNSATTCSFTVTVIDNEAPVLVCPDNQIFNVIANSCSANYTIADPISDNSTSGTWGYTLTGATTGTLSGIADGIGSSVLSYNKGITTVSLNGTDGTNSATTCSFTVTVSDNQAPILACPSNQTLNAIENTSAANYTLVDPISDNCIGSTWGYTLTGATTGTLSSIADDTGSGVLSFNKGVTTVTLSGTDGTNSASTCSFTVTVLDNQAPVLACPSNQTLNVIPNTCAAYYTITDPISDNGEGSTWGYTLTGATTGTLSGIGDGTGSDILSFNKGVTTVTLNGTDGTNSASTCSFTVTVSDNQAPILACPSNQTLNVIANTSAANYTLVDPISDNCIGSTWGYTLAGATTGTLAGIADGTGSGILSFNKGITTVTLSGTDGTNSASTCNFTVTVFDNQAPVLSCSDNQTLNVIANTCAANYTIVDPISDNNIGSTWGYTLTGATTGTLSSIADGIGSGILSFNKGITTVTLSGTDGTNNATTCSFTVTVLDNQAPILACPSNQILNVIANTCAANYTIADPIADNCTGSTWGYTLTGVTTGTLSSIADGTGSGILSFNKGVTTVALSGTDGTNSASPCSFTVTVTDNQKPTITAPIAVIVAADAGKCNASGVALGTPTIGDNCLVANVISDAVEPFALGNTTVNWTVTDGSGNAATATQTVTVNPNVTIGTVSGTTPLCMGETATYTSNGDIGGAWSSSNTSVASVNASGLVTTLSTGTTQIRYTLSGCTEPISAYKTLTVNPTIGATTFTTGATTLCQDAANETYTASAEGSSSIVYSVLPILAGTIGASSGVMNWDTAFSGNATITATSTGLCGTTTADRKVVVNPLPVANAGLPSTIIPGNSVTIGTTAVEGNTYSWVSNPAGFTSALANPTVSPIVTTTYTLTVWKIATDCANSDSVTITIANLLPIANAGADKTVYYGYPPSQCATLYASASEGTSPYKYSWSNGAVTESTLVCPMTTTIYTLTVTDANGYSATDDVTVNVIDVSCGNNKVRVCHENKTVCIAIPAVKAHLAHGDTLGDCSNVSSESENIKSSVTDVGNSLVLYPNPTAGTFTVEVYRNKVVDKAILQVVDFNGHIIYSKAPFRIDGYIKETIELNQAASPDGIYFLQLITGEKTETQKIILKR